MATITSVGSGLWSVAGTWDGGVPVDNDVVVIAAGHVVEFDVDQSGFANGVDGITITGTLKLTRTAGTYYLKIKAAKTIAGPGTFDCGTAISPIPFASKHTITGGAGWYINGGSGMTFTCYAVEPTIKYAKLINAEGAGSTVLEVDTDVTGDIWADGNTIFICQIGGKSSEERIIAVGGIASGSITITAGLSSAKSINAHIVLVTRNVTFLSAGGGAFIRGMTNANPAKLYGGCFRGSGDSVSTSAIEYGGGLFTGANGWHTGSNNYTSVLGGVFTNVNSAFQSWLGLKITYGIFIGMSYAISNSSLCSMLNGYVACAFIGFNGVSGFSLFGGVIKDCERGLSASPATIKGAVFENQQDVYSTQFVAFNTLFGGGTENYLYTSGDVTAFSESFDHDQVVGAYRAWTAGGVTTKQAVTAPVGYTSAMQTVLANAAKQGYWQKEITISAGASVNIEMNLRKSAAMTYLPRIIVFNKASTDPFAGGTGLYTFTMTNSIDTWEDDLYTYTNTTSEDITLVIRCQGMNATGNMYSLVDVEQINVDLTGAIAKIDVIDGLVDAIKAKTDQLAFTVANQVDANALTGGGGASAADVADAVWDEAMAGHVGVGTAGKAVADALEDTSTTIPNTLVDIENKIDVIATDTTTEIPASITALDSKIDTIDNYIDTEVAAIKAKTDNLPASPAAVGSAMTLTSGERTAIANEVEAQIINEADAERVLTAITDKIASVNPSLDDLTLAGIASAVRTELATELSRIDAAISSRLSSAGYTAPDNASISAIKAKTDNLPASPADQSELEVLIAALPPAPSASDIIAALKVAVFDGTLTFEDSIKLHNAMLFGKLDGGGSGTLKFRDPADTKDRVTATVDIWTGDRDDITLDLT